MLLLFWSRQLSVHACFCVQAFSRHTNKDIFVFLNQRGNLLFRPRHSPLLLILLFSLHTYNLEHQHTKLEGGVLCTKLGQHLNTLNLDAMYGYVFHFTTWCMVSTNAHFTAHKWHAISQYF
jgi:hypothetical protein